VRIGNQHDNFCLECGKPLVAGKRFCGACGASTAELSSPSAPSVAAAAEIHPPTKEAPAYPEAQMSPGLIALFAQMRRDGEKEEQLTSWRIAGVSEKDIRMMLATITCCRLIGRATVKAREANRPFNAEDVVRILRRNGQSEEVILHFLEETEANTMPDGSKVYAVSGNPQHFERESFNASLSTMERHISTRLFHDCDEPVGAMTTSLTR